MRIQSARGELCVLIRYVFPIAIRYFRYIIFTMEVAVAAMPPGVDQWVLILDAGGKLLLASLNLRVLMTGRIVCISEHSLWLFVKM